MKENFLTEYYPFMYLLIGLITLAYSIFAVSKKSDLKQTGIEVDGIIYDQEQDLSYHNSSYNIKDKITVRFVTQQQEWITAPIKQAFASFYTGQYKNGETVKVYYNKDKPTDFYVDTKQPEFLARIIFAVAGLVFISIGLSQLFT